MKQSLPGANVLQEPGCLRQVSRMKNAQECPHGLCPKTPLRGFPEVTQVDWGIRSSAGLTFRADCFPLLRGWLVSPTQRSGWACGPPTSAETIRPHVPTPGLPFSSQGKAEPPGCLCSHPVFAYRCCYNKRTTHRMAYTQQKVLETGSPSSAWRDSDESPPPGSDCGSLAVSSRAERGEARSPVTQKGTHP